MDPITTVGIILVIIAAWVMMSSDSTPANTPGAATSPETTTVSPTPEESTVSAIRRIADRSHVPDAVGMDEAKIELYTGKDFTGTKRTLYPGMKTKFAEMTSGKSLQWVYQSMKVVPGTYIMLTSSASGSMDRGFAVGKYDVTDMFAFIQSYDSIYDQKGIYMDRDYWARPFYIQVLTDTQWDVERKKKHDSCMNYAIDGLSYDTEKANEHCEYAEPESNMDNITGFRNGIRGGMSRSGFGGSAKTFY
jgi:hypothetical protein